MMNIPNLIYTFILSFFLMYLLYNLYLILQSNIKNKLKFYFPIILIIGTYILEIIFKTNEISFFYFPILKDIIIFISIIYIYKKITYKGKKK